MTRTLFKCDKCQQEWQEHPEIKDNKCPQKVNISMKLNYGYDYPAGTESYSGNVIKSETWCRPCIDACGIITPEREKNQQPQEESAEDVIAQFIARLGFTRNA